LPRHDNADRRIRVVDRPRQLSDSDSVPYTTGCLEFIEGAAENLHSLTHSTAALVSFDPSKPASMGLLTPGPACPENDNRPYTRRCIQFLSGWFWKAN